MTSAEPIFFNLDDGDDHEVANHAFMTHGENDGNASEEMEQDAGKTWHDDHRKVRSPSQRTNSEGEFCSDVGDKVPMPFSLPSDVTRADVMQILRENNALGSVAMGSEGPSNRYSGPMTGSLVDHQSRLVAGTQKVIQPVINANVEIREVVSMNAVRPNNLREMKAYELQAVCRDWNIQTSGTKGELLDRLERLFSGQEVAKKSCSMKFIKLVEEDPSAVQGPVLTVPQATNFPSPDRGPPSYPQQADPAYRRSAAVKIVDQLLPPSKEITRKDLVAGAELPSMLCWKCGAPMVARQNRRSGEWFFCCSKFPTTRCDVTHALFTGLEILNGRLEASRFPAGSASLGQFCRCFSASLVQFCPCCSASTCAFCAS